MRLFWALIAAWIASFILPAMKSSSFPNGYAEIHYGFDLAFYSIYFIWVPYFGQLWIVNIFMALAPLQVKRVREGKGLAYLLLLAVAALFPLPLLFMKPSLVLNKFQAWLPGFYMWHGALVGVAAWFFLFKRGYWRDLAQRRAQRARSRLDEISVWSPWRR
jgi:uncharacterized membrane protein YdjX (TVP38/TMEM64 family)